MSPLSLVWSVSLHSVRDGVNTPGKWPHESNGKHACLLYSQGRHFKLGSNQENAKDTAIDSTAQATLHLLLEG